MSAWGRSDAANRRSFSSANTSALTVSTSAPGSFANDATSADFDPAAIEQYGLDAQFTENDTRAWSTIFGGSGSVVADDGTTAQWPDNWRDGLQYFYDGIWTDHFIPDGTAVQGLADGNTFQSAWWPWTSFTSGTRAASIPAKAPRQP